MQGYNNIFYGMIKVSLVDFPGIVCSTLFTVGCNFDCLWCHNRHLVDPEKIKMLSPIEAEEIFSYFLKRKNLIQGVCISGGEPTLHYKDLIPYFRWFKSNDFLVKLDTNGYQPDILEDIIKEKFVDFIAMDIKNVFTKYPDTVNKNIDVDKIKKSISIIKNSGIQYEFRNTPVPDVVNVEDILNFAKDFGISIRFNKYMES